MKFITVETTGNFMLLDRHSRKEISHECETEVPVTEFIIERLRNGDLRQTGGDPVIITEDIPAAEEVTEAPAEEAPPADETPAETPAEETPAEIPSVDTDGDGHDDKSGQFVPRKRRSK